MTDEPRATYNVKKSDELTSHYDYDMDDLLAENRRLRAGLEQMQGNVLRLSQALEPMHRVNEEMVMLGAETALIRTELDSHRERREQLTHELSQRRGEVEGLRAILQGCRDQNKQLQDTCYQNREKIERLTIHLQAVLNSSSWRLTRPIRWLKQFITRLT